MSSLPTNPKQAFIEDLQAGLSINTRRAYVRHCHNFDQWMTETGTNHDAANDTLLASYLRTLHHKDFSPATIAQACAAICFRAKVNDHPNPRGRQVKAALKRIRLEGRERGRGQSDAITLDMYQLILEQINVPRRRGRKPETPEQTKARVKIDTMLLGLLFFGGLRCSEAEQLHVSDVLIPDQDREYPFVLIRVRESKTNRDAQREDIRFIKDEPAAEIMRTASLHSKTPEQKVLGITKSTIQRKMKYFTEGINGRFTPHSGRIGLASELVRMGASSIEVMHAGGWQTEQMVRHYSAAAKATGSAVGKYL